MTPAERRRQVLLQWAAESRARGMAVPNDLELGRIALHRGIPAGANSPLVARWRQVMMDLMWLADTGHRDPVGQVRQRSTPPPPSSGPGYPPPGPQAWPPPTGQPRQMPSAGRPQMPGPYPAPGPGLGQPPSARPPQVQVPPPSPGGPPPGSAASAPGWQLVGGHPSSGSSASMPSDAVMPSGGSLIVPNQGRPGPGQQPAQPPGQQPPPQQQPPAQTGGDQQVAPRRGTEPAPAPDTDDGEDDLITRLRAWRDDENVDEVKDRHLRMVVANDSRTVEEIAAVLPASARARATDILRVVNAFHATARRAKPEPTPAAAAPAVSGLSAPERPADPNEVHVSWDEPDKIAPLLDSFAPVDFSEEINPDPLPIRASGQGNELLLRWPAWRNTDRDRDGRPDDDRLAKADWFVIYRLVASDDMTPYSPDVGQVVAVTTRLGATDVRPPTGPVRRYQVWVNDGPTQEDAWANQPRLHAQAAVVAKPTAVDIREDEGRVIGQWGVAPGVRGVRVFRVPADMAHGGTGDPQYRILTNEANIGGFVDDGAEPGRHYVYQLLVEADVDGALQLSLPTVVPLTTKAILDPINDLTCTLEEGEDGAKFDLTWTPPKIGRVVIFRTTLGPLPGAEAETVAADALPQMRLPADERLAHPIAATADGKAIMQDVPWPRDWVRTYFTPVVLHGDQARVGRTIPQVRTRSVRDAKIFERVTQQVLTMPWPDGAATVQVFMSPPGEPAELAIGGTPFAEISAAAYKRFGGLHFPQLLDATGCDLHLVPLSFAGGEKIVGRPTTVRYPGLMRLYYGCEQLGNGLMMVRVRSEFDNPTAPPFVLVHNPTRLPLDVNDGSTVQVRAEMAGPNGPLMARFAPAGLSSQWSTGWVAEIASLGPGYLRVFADVRVDDLKAVAVLDPPMEYLRLGGVR
ncbi:hypothetical protein [Enemella sp. A6]|uniref:hypothetical protein n=1 Tax=Enemella sp. A6 TaxID=3440152 RepID=UPI003EBDF0A7